MKFIDFFKNSRPARAGGILLFCSLMVILSALSLKSLPEMAYYPSLDGALGTVALVSLASASIGLALLAFALFERKFSTVVSVFSTLLLLESLGMLAGLIIYLISLDAQGSFLALSTAMTFFYYFLGLLILSISLLCAIATSVCLLLFLTVRKAVKLKK